MTTLSPNDRSIVATWREHGGIPRDDVTVQAAYRIVCKALDDVDELHAILAEVGWGDAPRAREALREIRDVSNSHVVAGLVRWGLGECDVGNGLADPATGKCSLHACACRGGAA